MRAAGETLAVDDLSVDALTPAGSKRVLDGVGFTLRQGETLCLAGESGSGKSVCALSIMRLLPARSLRIDGGAIRLAGEDLTRLSERAMRRLRGGKIAMVFQEPMTSLNPVLSIGRQMTEAIVAHQETDARTARTRARAMLDAVHMTEAARRLDQYPHELSGGMRQRVMIAMALSCQPDVLIADEPTTALDVTIQAQILRLIRELIGEFRTSLLLITHDMGVVAEMADRVAVMQAGRIVEIGEVGQIFHAPKQAYTRELLAAVPRLGAMSDSDGPPRVTSLPLPAPDRTPVLSVRNLTVAYPGAANWLGRTHEAPPVVDDVSFDIMAGRTLGLVGESGSGKSTTGKAALGLLRFHGSVAINGREIAALDRQQMQLVRRDAQMIFQDPYASLDPRMAVGKAIEEPLVIHGLGGKAERRERVAMLLERVHLLPDHAGRYPHEFSGGQRQRICIARALALKPKLIVADESVAALDVSVRARVLDLMLELQEELELTYLFISHDMAVIERMCHDVAVMQAGRIVETNTRRRLFAAPTHPHTQALLAAVPVADPAHRLDRAQVD